MKIILEDNSLDKNWFGKPTLLGRYLNFMSSYQYPSCLSEEVINYGTRQIKRSLKLLNEKFQNTNIETIKKTFIRNYNESFVDSNKKIFDKN